MSEFQNPNCTNCGCLERIKHLENENEVQWRNMEKQEQKIDKFLFRINATFITLLVFALGVVANLGYLILKGLDPGG
jgi:hypothetical protein